MVWVVLGIVGLWCHHVQVVENWACERVQVLHHHQNCNQLLLDSIKGSERSCVINKGGSRVALIGCRSSWVVGGWFPSLSGTFLAGQTLRI